MCGIAGCWKTHDAPLSAADSETVAAMMERLTHRGPDASGRHSNRSGTMVLGHQRLSIMDPKGGDQPIYNEARNQLIVSNGEIYNHKDLRKNLASRYRFRTGSDSEAALHLYEDLGKKTASRLDGMFAMAIGGDDGLYLARDPIGIKPLYYGKRGRDWVFASELKALSGVAKEVKEFPPGHWYHSKLGFKRYYEIPDPEPRAETTEETLAVLRRTLNRAVDKRLMSDVPLGVFLSGGLDSSLIAALAKKKIDPLHSFSVGVAGCEDLAAARQVAAHLGTTHHEYVYTREELLKELPHILYCLESFDQDLVRSAIPCYFVSRMAAQHVTVVLSGEGADELFAGYSYHKEGLSDDALRKELRRSIGTLHGINLQRVDRMTMAHSLEGRVPFLDTEMIELGLSIPVALKLKKDSDGRLIEKWVLRKAFEDLLPRDIVWRVKQQFDQGTGTVDILSEGLEMFLPKDQTAAYQHRHSGVRLRSHEECVYHKLLCEAYPDPSIVLENVARWTDDRTS